MVIVKVTFTDWNGTEHQVNVTSDMCESLHHCEEEEELICVAIRYIKRRYVEWTSINTVEIIAK